MAAISPPSIQTAVLSPGQCIILPQGAVVTSVIVDGAASVTSTCGSLPIPSTYKCGYFYLILDVDDNSGHSMNEENTYYTSLKIGGNTYIINELVVTGENPGTLVPVGTLNLHIPNTPLFEFMAVVRTVLSKRQGINLYFRAPVELFNGIVLKVDNYGSPQLYAPFEAECGEYPAPA